MDFTQPLEKATLVRRYKRFLVDVVMTADGCETTAHCPNPGAMMGLADPGMTVWLSRSASPTRKLPLSLELVEADGGLVGVNTMHPNRLVAEALARDGIAEVSGYDRVRPEVKYGEKSRVDFLLESDSRPPCWLEIKNVHLMRRPGLAEFPDCVAARSARHLRELSTRVGAGDRAVALFVIQRTDCDRVAAAADLDPGFAVALRDALKAGVEVLAYACTIDISGVSLADRLPVLSPCD
jgi:sugar fermentation stimulation protein A